MTKEFVQYLKDAIIIKGKIQVPGIGTFRGEFQAAQADEKNKILPPALLLFFTEKTSKEEENIIDFLINDSGLPSELANQMVRQFIQELKNNLATSRSSAIGDLGKLHYDAKQKLTFSSNEKGNFYTAAHGLEPAIVTPVSKKSKLKAQTSTNKVKKEKEKVVKSAEKVIGEAKPKLKKLWPVWAVVILLLIAVPISTILMKGGKSEYNIGKVITAKSKAFWSDITSFSKNLTQSGLLAQKDSVPEENTVVFSNNAELNTQAENDVSYEENNKEKIDSSNTKTEKEVIPEPKIENNVSTKAQETKPENKEVTGKQKVDQHYALTGLSDAKINEIVVTKTTELYLIAGSFKNEDNANRLREELISLGYQSVIVGAEGGLNRVSLGKFKTVDEALKIFQKFHTKRPEVAVWLLVRK
jgi:cell division septation protein DedD/nucleoid DNA-binding protein